MTDVSYPAAVGAGLLSFLSPLRAAAGAALSLLSRRHFAGGPGGRAGGPTARRDTVIAALLFVAGFSTVFVALGATASFFGALLRQWSHVLSIAGRRRHHRDGASFPRRVSDRRDDAGESGSKSPNRRGYGAPT